MSDTPRTDDQIGHNGSTMTMINIHFVRQLERELAAVTAERDRLRAVNRSEFEEWISSPPYEHEVLRYPDDQSKYAWPGQYRNIAVQLAWDAWCRAKQNL